MDTRALHGLQMVMASSLPIVQTLEFWGSMLKRVENVYFTATDYLRQELQDENDLINQQ